MRQFRSAINQANRYIEIYSLNPLRRLALNFHSSYRHSLPVQYCVLALGSVVAGYIFANIMCFENKQKNVIEFYETTEYCSLVNKLRKKDKNEQSIEAVRIVLEKGKRQGLTSMELLAINQLIKKAEINIHGQYLASLK